MFSRQFWARVLRRMADRLAPAPDWQAEINSLATERSWFWNQTVSAHEVLRGLGWPGAGTGQWVHLGIEWLAEKEQVAP